MKKDRFEKSINIFKNNGGMLRASNAIKLGVPEHQIYEMVKTGMLTKEDRGLYRLESMEPLSNPDLVKLSLLVPKAVICLISALYFHNLTTQIPYEIYFALPSDVKAPRITYPPINITWLSPQPYSVGIETHLIDGVNVQIYNREKTIADCFKFRSKIGNDVALEALKDYVRQPNPQVGKLLEYARINRVENVIKPFLETLI